MNEERKMLISNRRAIAGVRSCSEKKESNLPDGAHSHLKGLFLCLGKSGRKQETEEEGN